jgi:hypothetical protein
MARRKYTRHTERRGKGLRGKYQGNAQVSQESDVGSSIDRVAQQKHIPASLYFLVMMTGGISNLPGYFRNMLDYSLVCLLSGVNRFW